MTAKDYRLVRLAFMASKNCPCGLPADYAECCGRFHRGEGTAPTAELLMRSRFSAFSKGDEAYLLKTWHPSTRPGSVEFDKGLRWTELEVLESKDGAPFQKTGTVRFRAHYIERGKRGHMEEHSRFSRHEDAWVYVGPI